MKLNRQHFKPGIITKARMDSTRLPGKVMKTINGKPLLEYHLERAQQADLPVIVATGDQPDDDVIAKFCEEKSIPFCCGSILRRGPVHSDVSHTQR